MLLCFVRLVMRFCCFFLGLGWSSCCFVDCELVFCSVGVVWGGIGWFGFSLSLLFVFVWFHVWCGLFYPFYFCWRCVVVVGLVGGVFWGYVGLLFVVLAALAGHAFGRFLSWFVLFVRGALLSARLYCWYL